MARVVVTLAIFFFVTMIVVVQTPEQYCAFGETVAEEVPRARLRV